jgi:hypothetical protein
MPQYLYLKMNGDTADLREGELSEEDTEIVKDRNLVD